MRSKMGRRGLTAADAQGSQAVSGVAAVRLSGEGGQAASPGGADRVAEREARTAWD